MALAITRSDPGDIDLTRNTDLDIGGMAKELRELRELSSTIKGVKAWAA